MSLVSAAELAEALAQPVPEMPVAVCDVRFHLADHDQGAREYAEGHVPGARFVDLHRDLADVTRRGAGRHPLPSPQAFGVLLRRLGIHPTTHAVAYDAAAGATAARLWWMLQSIGHARVSVLDGGWPAWVAGGYAVSAAEPDIEPTDYPIPAATTWPGAVSADEVAAAIADGSAVVIDSRAPERYRGEVEPLDPRAGHVPIPMISKRHSRSSKGSARSRSFGRRKLSRSSPAPRPRWRIRCSRIAGKAWPRPFPLAWKGSPRRIQSAGGARICMCGA